MKEHGLFEEILPKRESLFDDIPIEIFGEEDGQPIRLTNPEIRRMLRLASADNNDIFYDLGCGFAQNLIIAASEFGIKESVGVEEDESRFLIAQKRIDKWIASGRISKNQIKVKFDTTERLIEGKVPGADLKKASIIYYGLDPLVPLTFKRRSVIESEFIQDALVRSGIKDSCNIITYFHNGIFTVIMPSSIDYPFYLYEYPFDHHIPKSELHWLRSVIQRENKVKPTQKVKAAELWDELTHDYNMENFSREEVRTKVDSYKNSLRDYLKKTRIRNRKS